MFPPRSDSRRRSRRDRRPVLGTDPAILRRISKLHSTRSRHRNMVHDPDPRPRSCRNLNDIKNCLRMPDDPRSLSSHGSVPGVRRAASELPFESIPNRIDSQSTGVSGVASPESSRGLDDHVQRAAHADHCAAEADPIGLPRIVMPSGRGRPATLKLLATSSARRRR